MSQRTVSAVYALYRRYIEEGNYTLARDTFERYLADVSASMLRIAIFDYIV